MKKEDFDVLEIIDLILGVILIFAIVLFLIEVEEFHDDYKCTITTDAKYYDEHNCKRFER